MCMCFLPFFLVSSVVSHCRCVFTWVACICANDRLLRLSRGGLHRHFFFGFLRMQDVARTSNIALLLWQTHRADQDSFFRPPLVSLLNNCEEIEKCCFYRSAERVLQIFHENSQELWMTPRLKLVLCVEGKPNPKIDRQLRLKPDDQLAKRPFPRGRPSPLPSRERPYSDHMDPGMGTAISAMVDGFRAQPAGLAALVASSQCAVIQVTRKCHSGLEGACEQINIHSD